MPLCVCCCCEHWPNKSTEFLWKTEL